MNEEQIGIQNLAFGEQDGQDSRLKKNNHPSSMFSEAINQDMGNANISQDDVKSKYCRSPSYTQMY